MPSLVPRIPTDTATGLPFVHTTKELNQRIDSLTPMNLVRDQPRVSSGSQDFALGSPAILAASFLSRVKRATSDAAYFRRDLSKNSSVSIGHKPSDDWKPANALCFSQLQLALNSRLTDPELMFPR